MALLKATIKVFLPFGRYLKPSTMVEVFPEPARAITTVWPRPAWISRKMSFWYLDQFRFGDAIWRWAVLGTLGGNLLTFFDIFLLGIVIIFDIFLLGIVIIFAHHLIPLLDFLLREVRNDLAHI